MFNKFFSEILEKKSVEKNSEKSNEKHVEEESVKTEEEKRLEEEARAEREAERRLEAAEAEKVSEKIFPEKLENYDLDTEKLKKSIDNESKKILEIENQIEKAEDYTNEKYKLMNKKSYIESVIKEREIDINELQEKKAEESDFREKFKCIDKPSKEEMDIVRKGLSDDFKLEGKKVIKLSDVSIKERDLLKEELNNFDSEFQKKWQTEKAKAIENCLNGKSGLTIEEVNKSFERAENAHNIALAKKISEMNKRIEEVDKDYKSKHTFKGRISSTFSKYLNKKNNESVEEYREDSDKDNDSLEANNINDNDNDFRNELEALQENIKEDKEDSLEKMIEENYPGKTSDEVFRSLMDEMKEEEKEDSLEEIIEENYPNKTNDELFRSLMDEMKEEEDSLEKMIEENYPGKTSDEVFQSLMDEMKEEEAPLEEIIEENYPNKTNDELFRSLMDEMKEEEENSLEKMIEENYPGQTVKEVFQSLIDELGLNENIENIEEIENKREVLELDEKYEKYRDDLEDFDKQVTTLLNQIYDAGGDGPNGPNINKRLLDTLLEQHAEAENRGIGDHGIRHILANVNRSNELYDKYCEETGKEINPREKLALIIAQIHHDEGYLIRTEIGKDGDHDKVSGEIFEEKHKKFYSDAVFNDEEGRKYLEKAQEALGKHNVKTKYIEQFDDENLIKNCLLVSDKLSVYADEKLPEFLVNNPQAMAEIKRLSLVKSLEEQGVLTADERKEYEDIFKEKLKNCIDIPDKEKLMKDISDTSAQYILGMNNGRIGNIKFVKDDSGQVILDVDIETIEKNSDTGRFLDNEYFYKENKETGEMEVETTLQEKSVEKIKGDFGDYSNENSGVKLNFKEIKEEEIDTEILEIVKNDAREWRDSKFLDGIREKAILDMQNLDKDLENIEDLSERAYILNARIADINTYLDNYLDKNFEEITEEEKDAIYEISKSSTRIIYKMKAMDISKSEMNNYVENFKMEALKILNKDKLALLNSWKER